MKHFNLEYIEKLEQRFRTNFINSLSGFKSLNLIATINNKKQTNLAIFNSVFHLGANPALIGFVVRPDSVDRHTLSNILETNYYTINHVNQSIIKQAHQTSARYEQNQSEFEATGLTPEFKNNFFAPFVKESNIQIAVEFKERVNIELNGTCIIVGKITDVYFENNCLCTDGFLDIEKAKSVAGIALDSYHTTNQLARFSYAKPNVPLSEVKSNHFD